MWFSIIIVSDIVCPDLLAVLQDLHFILLTGGLQVGVTLPLA
jgi:hypothetical protein